MWLKRYIKIIIIIICVGLILFGVYSLARVLVNNTYSSVDMVEEDDEDNKENKNNLSSEENLNKEEDTKEYSSDGTDSEFQKVTKLFDNENLSERQPNYLGDKYSKYQNILSYIESNYNSVFESLSLSSDQVISVDADYELYAGSISSFDWNAIQEYNNVYVRDSSTIIGLYGDSCVVYAYNLEMNDKIQLFVVDYSEAKLSTNNKILFDFGQEKNLLFSTLNCKYETVDGCELIYFKEW